jgi:hypothetical protein
MVLCFCATRGDISPIAARGGPSVSEAVPSGGFPKKRLFFSTTEASKSMKTNDRSGKIGEKQTGFCAEMTRILQEKQVSWSPVSRYCAHQSQL